MIIIKIFILLSLLMLTIMLYTYWERRFIGFIQDRHGPNRVGFCGLLQPIADSIKLLVKSMIIPNKANKFLFMLGPIIVVITALSAWAVIPFSQKAVLANINVGVLYILAITSLSVYGIVIAGWASNSKFALFGAMRAATQLISYSIPMSFAIVGVLMKANSMNLTTIVHAQQGGITNWFCLPLLPLLVIYWICAMAETNRLPFDIAEGESELVAGFHVEYSAMGFALFFIAEYSNMILTSVLTVIMFFGGWLPPSTKYLLWVPSYAWLLIKVFILMTLFLWIRATFPRYRIDQIMRIGWKVFIPITLFWLTIEAFWLDFMAGNIL
jgi:NADH-quinone oxidoreductase subunit H